MKQEDSSEGVSTEGMPEKALPKPRTQEFTDAMRNLLEHSVSDRWIRVRLAAASLFLQSPRDTLLEIQRHVDSVGYVLSAYYQKGIEPPSEICVLDRLLLELLCRYRIRAVTRELKPRKPDGPKLREALRMAIADTRILRMSYQDDTLLKEVEALQQRIDLLVAE
jgi:hypothetical protein